MYYVPVSKKFCATCKWWRGKRELFFNNAPSPISVKVDNIRCEGKRCVSWNAERGPTCQCSRWVKWERM